MSKSTESKPGNQLPVEADIFAETLRRMRSKMSEAPVNPGTEAEIIRRHFIRGSDQNTQSNTPDIDPQPDQPTEEPIH